MSPTEPSTRASRPTPTWSTGYGSCSRCCARTPPGRAGPPRVAQESIDALTAAGVFKIAQPRRYGGYETSMRTMLDVSAAVGEADGGTAWVVTLLNVCAWLTGLYPRQAQDDVWGDDPDALVCGVLAPTAETGKVEGGPAGDRPLVLRLRLLARELGGARHPGHRRRGRGRRPGHWP